MKQYSNGTNVSDIDLDEIENMPIESLMVDQHVANKAWLNGELSDDERDDMTRLNYLASLE